MKFQETEVKYPLYNSKEVIEILEKSSAKKTLNSQVQLDVYYSPRYKKFIDTEWLRIRVCNNKRILCYKKLLTTEIETVNHCNEIEVLVDDVEAMEAILKALDIFELVRIEKTRSSWILDDIEISIDFIESLGCFVELEAIEKITDISISAIQERFKKLTDLLNADIGALEKRGYPFLMIGLKSNII